MSASTHLSPVSNNARGGIIGSGPMCLTNTILTGNIVTNNHDLITDCGGSFTSDGHNCSGKGSGCGLLNGQNGDQVVTLRT